MPLTPLRTAGLLAAVAFAVFTLRAYRQGKIGNGDLLLRILVAVADKDGVKPLVRGDDVARSEFFQAPVADGDLLRVYRGLKASHLVRPREPFP